jgi:hypothetical protein
MFTPDKRLQKLYDKYNKLYFNGELPSDTQVGWMDYPKHTPVAETATADGCGVIHHTIYLSHYIRPFKTIPKQTLLHEMVHVKLHPYSKHDRKRFDAEMLRLAQAGALHDLW